MDLFRCVGFNTVVDCCGEIVFIHSFIHTSCPYEVVTFHYVCPVLQEGSFLVRTHHVEYCDGGILDPDDILSDLVEDKDKVRSFSVHV